MKITATIITLNEEKNLDSCLRSIKQIADEIVVIDSGSQDKTLDIAKKYNAKIFTRKFDNYAKQKNFALEKSTGEWILSLDGDEEITAPLAEEIKSVVYDKDFNGYLIPRKNIIFGAEIKHTRWSPDKHVWLFRRGFAKWKGEVHEEVEVEGEVSELKNPKIHHSYEKVADFWTMMNGYTELIAQDLVKKGIKFSLLRLFWATKLSFFRRFFYKKGFLDGWRGFVLSYLMAIYRMTTWVKVWERSQKSV